jgi:hypothetical protein
MIKRDELIAMRAIALCYKPFLKPEEALIYCYWAEHNLQRNVINSESIKMPQDIIRGKK